jgi:tetratricopeptide (TPR) repeat protein
MSVSHTLWALIGQEGVVSFKKGLRVWRFCALCVVLLCAIVSCGESAEAHDKRGREYADAEEYDKAIEAFSKAIEIRPGYADAYNNRGNTYRKMGQYDQATADLNKAIELDPSHYKAYKNRGKVYAAQENWVRALADYDETVELNPDYAPVYYDRAMAHKNLGDPEACVRDLVRFVEMTDDPEMRQRATEELKALGGN